MARHVQHVMQAVCGLKWHINVHERCRLHPLYQLSPHTSVHPSQAVMHLQTSIRPTNTRPVCAFACGQPRSFRQQDARQVLQFKSTLTSRHLRARTLVPRAAAVETHDKFRLNHSVSVNNFEVKGDLDKVFTYAADFSHISGWDSGTS